VSNKEGLEPTEKLRLLEQLSGRSLSGVTFVLDYVQLQFDPPPTVTAFTRMSVRPNGKEITVAGDDQFRNLLCAQISKVVGLVTVRI
jgi:hypothetical protein